MLLLAYKGGLFMHVNKPYEQLSIRDPFMFGKISSDPRNAEIILSSLLATDISINHSAMEHHIQLLSSKKYVKLDLFAIDKDGTNYDAEMQNKSKNPNRQKELPKRSRYYQCMLDGEILDTGIDYLDMNNSYIIFICDFDPFDSNLYQYTFVHKCKEDATIELGDGATIIFFNLTAEATSAPESTRNMLSYFASGKINDESTKVIDTAVSTAKEKEEWRQEYMLTFVHDKDVYNEGHSAGLAEGHSVGLVEGHSAGLAEGHSAGREEAIIELIRDNLITVSEGAKRLNITESELIKLMNK